MNDRVDLATVLRSVGRRWWLALLVAATVTQVGYAVSSSMPRVYAATTSVLVGETTESSTLDPEQIKASQDLAVQYADLARREPVLGAVVRELGLATTWLSLRERVQVNLAPGNSQLIIVAAESSTPREAVRIARAVAEQMIRLSPQRNPDPESEFVKTQIDQLQREIAAKQQELSLVASQQLSADGPERLEALRARSDTLLRQLTDLRDNYTELRGLVPQGRGPNRLSVLEPAAATADPVRPDVVVNTAVALLAGALLAVAVCYWLEHRAVQRPLTLDELNDLDDLENLAPRGGHYRNSRTD